LIEPFRGPVNGRTLNVDGELLIGREPTAGVTISGALISRRHVLVRALHDGLEIEDISSHGTLVDGETLRLTRRRVGRECTLHVGCVCVWLRRVLPSDATTLDLRETRQADSDPLRVERR
jgi:predicted component of type VI protein secretion system